MTEQNAEAPAEKKARVDNEAGDKANGTGAVIKPLAELTTLENFVFKEVLGALPEKKVQCLKFANISFFV
jgi:hypothetical protein